MNITTVHTIEDAERVAVGGGFFVYAHHNVSNFDSDRDGLKDQVEIVLYRLRTYTLDVPSFYNAHARTDLRGAIRNPEWSPYQTTWRPRYLNGERIYKAANVWRFWGNFIEFSGGYLIDTNHPDTIARLRAATNANIDKWARDNYDVELKQEEATHVYN